MSKYSQEIIKKKPGYIPEEIVMIQILEMMKWSYEDYMNTPQYIIDLIIEKNNIDNKLKK